MKTNGKSTPRLPREYDLGVLIIFLIITIVLVISLTQSNYGKEFVKSIQIGKNIKN